MVGDLTCGTPDPWDFAPDGVVDGSDLYCITAGYGAYPGISVGPQYPIWHPNSDITGDEAIDGDDLYHITSHYGEADP